VTPSPQPVSAATEARYGRHFRDLNEELDVNFYAPPPRVARPISRAPIKTPREKSAESYSAALAGVLFKGLAESLAAGDQDKAVSFINRGFAEGSPRLGCDLLCEAIAIVGPGRTWTAQLAPLSRIPPKTTIEDNPSL
jgi:hypothetical protein